MRLERRNAYFCNKCKRVTITVDVDNGVTPMFNSCIHCGEMASSFMYQIPGCMRFGFKEGKMVTLEADLEWYKPNGSELKKLPSYEKEHVNKGGLLCRKRTDREPIYTEIKTNQ